MFLSAQQRDCQKFQRADLSMENIYLWKQYMKSHLKQQEMDRILNACCLFEVANITHIWAHAPAEVFDRGHICVNDGG